MFCEDFMHSTNLHYNLPKPHSGENESELYNSSVSVKRKAVDRPATSSYFTDGQCSSFADYIFQAGLDRIFLEEPSYVHSGLTDNSQHGSPHFDNTNKSKDNSYESNIDCFRREISPELKHGENPIVFLEEPKPASISTPLPRKTMIMMKEKKILENSIVFFEKPKSVFNFSADHSSKTFLSLDAINKNKDNSSGSNDELRERIKRPRITVDKTSEIYREKRERNNIAVRKSREKARQLLEDTEERENRLVSEIQELKIRKEHLIKELDAIKQFVAWSFRAKTQTAQL